MHSHTVMGVHRNIPAKNYIGIISITLMRADLTAMSSWHVCVMETKEYNKIRLFFSFSMIHVKI